MKVVGYIRVSSDKQDLQKQEHLLLKYAQQQDLKVDDFINIEISSRRGTKERRIDELLARLNAGDVLLVAELSRLGRNMFEVINIINQLSQQGVEAIFVRQPELSQPRALTAICCWRYIVILLKRSVILFRCARSKAWLLHERVAKNLIRRRAVVTRRET